METIPAESGEAKYNEYFGAYLGEVDHEIRVFVQRGGQGLWNDVSQLTSHRIALMYPTNGGKYYTARLATWWIAYRVAVATEKESNLLVYSGGNTNGVQGGHEECQKRLNFLWQSG